jgi:hypothetical protein
MTPLTLGYGDGKVLHEYRSLSIIGPPALPAVKARQVTDGVVFLAANYAYIQDNGRGRTYVLGLQSVQLDFQHMESPSEELAEAAATKG